MTNPSTTMIRGETTDCGNPKLDVFFTIAGVVTDVSVLEFQIFDITIELAPVQVFPLLVGTREPVAVGIICPAPGAGKIATGRYVATYTVDAAEPLGPHEVRWFYKQLPTSPEEVFAEQFEISLIDASGTLDPAGVDAFKKRFPDLAGNSSELIQCVLDEAECEIDRACFGIKAETAKLYLAAHLLVMSQGALAKGAASVTAGSASISYSAAGSALALGSTNYGKQYLRLARQCTGAQVLC